MAKIKIPAIAFAEVDANEFADECAKKFLPSSDPKFALRQVVMLKGEFGRELPAIILSVEARDGGWFYSLARPRWIDGVLERVGASEDKLTAVAP